MGRYKAYVIGFIASIVLTICSFSLVILRPFSEQILIYTVVGLALVQAVVQLLFFLHVGQEAKPRWETLVFFFMAFILLIIAIGTLWIMYDLNNRTMSNMAKEMIHD